MASVIEEAAETIRLLRDHLPDSIHEDSEDWEWAWNELFSETQDKVKHARKQANDWLDKYKERR